MEWILIPFCYISWLLISDFTLHCSASSILFLLLSSVYCCFYCISQLYVFTSFPVISVSLSLFFSPTLAMQMCVTATNWNSLTSLSSPFPSMKLKSLRSFIRVFNTSVMRFLCWPLTSCSRENSASKHIRSDWEKTENHVIKHYSLHRNRLYFSSSKAVLLVFISL